MKKLVCVTLIAAMVVSMATACGIHISVSTSSEPTETTNMANPVHECSKDQLSQETGIDFATPDGATDVKYSYIDGDEKTGQVEFTLDGAKYCYRAQNTQTVDIKADDTATKLCGLYEDWDENGETTVSNRPAIYGIKADGPSYIAWLDVVPGVMYSLSVDTNSSVDALRTCAEACFLPMQGEA